MGESISVILPIHRWHEHVVGSIRSVLNQTFRDFECIVVVNGTDQELLSNLPMIESLDPRIKLIRVDRENLALALNRGIYSANHELIARMDADDVSDPNRFEQQVLYMHEHPRLAGCGTGAYFIDAKNSVRDAVMPPISDAQARWKLMIWNPFVHGSMMLRKSHVLQVGGYDERLERAQDFDLWCRISHIGLGGVQSVLYTHRLHIDECHENHKSPATLSESQSKVTADCLQRAWESLGDQKTEGVAEIMAKIARGQIQGRVDIEQLMESHGPTQELLRAWMWSCAVIPIKPTDTNLRFRRLEAAAELIKSLGIDRIWIWGAGDFGRFILAHQSLIGAQIAGVLDDHRHGQQLGEFIVQDPNSLDHHSEDINAALIASELYEKQIWERSLFMRDQGVRVLRLLDAQSIHFSPHHETPIGSA